MAMPIELQVLAWTVVLGLAHVVVGAQLATMQNGLKWNASARDQSKPLHGVAARVDRALKNYLETYAFFAAAVLAVVLAQRTSDTTATAAWTYLIARVVYIPLYAAGIPHVRTLVWLVSFIAICVLVAALF